MDVNNTNRLQGISVKELGHIVLYVRSLARSVDFYERILGWERVESKSDAPIAIFSSGRTHHELLLIEVGSEAAPKPDHLQVGLYHFGLKVGDSDEELKKALVVLQKNNIPLSGATDHYVTHSLYIQDPDGNQIELYIDVQGVDWRNDLTLITKRGRRLVLE